MKKTVIKAAQSVIIFLCLSILAERLESMLVFIVAFSWWAFCFYARDIPTKKIFEMEFYSLFPLVFSPVSIGVNEHFGVIPASVFFMALIFISFTIRIILFQVRHKEARFHNTTMLTLFVLLIVCFEMFLGESEMGVRYKMRNLGVEYIISKATFWAPKDFREKFFQTTREYIINDVISERPKRKAVYFFGGSSTAGAGLENPADAFPSLFKSQLEGSNGDPSPMVINAGVGGYTTFQIRKLIENYIGDISAELFIFYIGYNDTQKTYGRYTHKEIYELMYKKKGEGGSALGVIQSTLGSLHTYNLAVNAFNHLKESLKGTSLDITVRAVPIQDMEENLRIIRDICQERGIGMMVFAEASYKPLRPEKLAHTRNELMKMCSGIGIPFADFHKFVHGLPDPGQYFLDDVHLTPAGHRLAVDFIKEGLRKEGLLKFAQTATP